MSKLPLQTSQLDMALQQGALHHFLAGDPPYFVHAKVDNDEPQNVQQAFDLQIYPYLKKSHDPAFADQMADALIQMIHSHRDTHRALYLAHTWIWYCLHCEHKKTADPKGYYADLPAFDFSDVALLLQRKTSEHAAALRQDTRWAGANWNSSAGLWEPMVKLALAVRDRLGGPDAVPIES